MLDYLLTKNYICSREMKEKALEMLVQAVRDLGLIPRTGFGELKFVIKFQDGFMEMIEDDISLKTQTKVRIKM